MAPRSGFLHAGQIDYIIRTVFQDKDDFITLERREDGNTVWRKSAFDSLGGRCAFYSAKDEGRVIRYLKSWTHKSVMPAYFFYDYKRGGMDVPSVCSACGHVFDRNLPATAT